MNEERGEKLDSEAEDRREDEPAAEEEESTAEEQAGEVEEQDADEDGPAAPEPPREPVDRRRSYRLNKVLGAEIESGGEVKKARLFVIDISASGFRATNNEPFPVEQDLKVRIALVSGETPIEGLARVVWQKELSLSGMFQCGFEFQEMEEDGQERLEAFIEQEREQSRKGKEDKTPYLGRPWTTIK